jgi:proteinaceous RNase P
LERKGPLPYLVDGANVGMYNQNFQESKFNFNQNERVMAHLRPSAAGIQKERKAQFGGAAAGAAAAAVAAGAAAAGTAAGAAATGAAETVAEAGAAAAGESSEKKAEEGVSAEAGAGAEGEKSEAAAGEQAAEAGAAEGSAAAAVADTPAVSFKVLSATAVGAGVPVNFLHVRRVRGGPANHHNAQRCINNWRHAGELFTTPAGSNDDWYWLYAAVASGDDSFLVSNDEMRDHVFQMLPAPKLFQR